MPGIVCNGTGCKEKPIYDITYDAGTHDQHLVLCQKHFQSNQIFKNNIKDRKKIKEIKN